MRLYTHSQTPKPKMSKWVKGLLIFSWMLIYSLFCLTGFVIIFDAHQILIGIIWILVTLVMGAYVFLLFWGMEQAHVELQDDSVFVVNYCVGFKREKRIPLSEIDRALVLYASSMRLHGPRVNVAGVQYIEFRNRKNKYLFKVYYCPASAEAFRTYLDKSVE